MVLGYPCVYSFGGLALESLRFQTKMLCKKRCCIQHKSGQIISDVRLWSWFLRTKSKSLVLALTVVLGLESQVIVNLTGN